MKILVWAGFFIVLLTNVNTFLNYVMMSKMYKNYIDRLERRVMCIKYFIYYIISILINNYDIIIYCCQVGSYVGIYFWAWSKQSKQIIKGGYFGF